MSRLSPQERFDHVLDRWSALRTARSYWLTECNRVGEIIWPGRIHAVGEQWYEDGQQRDQKKRADSTATQAIEAAAAGLKQGMTPQSMEWFALEFEDAGLMEFDEGRAWLEYVQTAIKRVLDGSNWYGAAHESYGDILAFNLAPLWVETDYERDKVHFSLFQCGEYCLGADQFGNVDTIYRKFVMTPRQMAQRFGLENLSKRLQNVLTTGKRGDPLTTRVELIQACEPNQDYEEKYSTFPTRKKWSDVYLDPGDEDRKLLRETGHDNFPVVVPRWSRMSWEVYGQSPAMRILPDVKTLMRMKQDVFLGIQKQVSPPTQGPNSLKGMVLNSLPGGFNKVTGNEKIEPLYPVNLNLADAQNQLEALKQDVKRGLHSDLFRLISDDTRSNITAQEIMARNAEKLQILGPVIESLQKDCLEPVIQMAYRFAQATGKIPPAPQELVGQSLGIRYVSTLAMAQKTAEVQGIQQTYAFAAQMAQANPEILDKLNMDEALEQIARITGAPEGVLKSDKEAEEARAARAQQMAQMQQMQMMNEAGAQAVDAIGKLGIKLPMGEGENVAA